ncbi:MAG: hypothetical protein ACREP7_02570, partial [Lysobacter sp.]
MNLSNPLAPVQAVFSWLASLFSQARSLYRPVAEGAKKPWLLRLVVAVLALGLLIALAVVAIAVVPT